MRGFSSDRLAPFPIDQIEVCMLIDETRTLPQYDQMHDGRSRAATPAVISHFLIPSTWPLTPHAGEGSGPPRSGGGVRFGSSTGVRSGSGDGAPPGVLGGSCSPLTRIAMSSRVSVSRS